MIESYKEGDTVELVSTGLEGKVVRIDEGDSLPFKVKFDCFTSYYEEKDLKGVAQRNPLL
jgi:preprotein translocase subunit YajC